MSTATEPRAAESPVASPAPPASKVPPATTGTPAGPPPATLAPGYRSIADGELATPWSLGEYFGSLNTVMRLPPKLRKRVEAIEKRTGIKLPDIQLPKGVVAAALVGAGGRLTRSQHAPTLASWPSPRDSSFSSRPTTATLPTPRAKPGTPAALKRCA